MTFKTVGRVQSTLYYSNLVRSDMPSSDNDERKSQNLEFLRYSATQELWPYRVAIRDYLQKLKEDKLANSFAWEPVESVAESSKKTEEGYRMRILPGHNDKELTFSHSAEDISVFFESEPEQICYDEILANKSKRSTCVKVIGLSPDDEILTVKDLPKPGTVIYPKNFDIGLKRQQDAIEKLINRPEPHQLPLLLLSSNQDESWRWDNVLNREINHWFVLNDSDFPGVKYQRDAVSKALSSQDFTILEGPPGSGKTTVLTETILQKLKDGERILLVASTHIAVDNVLEKIVDHLDIAMPLRISSGTRELDENISRFTYSKILFTTKSIILGKLEAELQSLSKAQMFWFQLLQGKQADKILSNVITDSINLVCATTIGSLNFPSIYRMESSRAYFDTMVIDEASKTTFTEFLVPALYCRKWVISGDPMQLSPYVNDKMLQGALKISLRRIMNEWSRNEEENESSKVLSREEEIERACIDAFDSLSILQNHAKSGKSHSPVICLVYDAEETIYPRIVRGQFESIQEVQLKEGRVFAELQKDEGEIAESVLRNSLSILSSDLIECDKQRLRSIKGLFPPGSYFLGSNDDLTRAESNQNNFFDRLCGVRRRKRKQTDVYDQILWRLKRVHELKRRREESDKFSKEISCLIPNFDEDLNENLKRAVLDLKKVALPSIVESLLEGSEPDPNEDERFLTHGFSAEIKNPRYTKLMFQYRMHPEISRYPRELFYTDVQSGESALQDPENMASVREDHWEDPIYSNRVEWINVKGKERGERGKFNDEEMKRIFIEFDKFLSWSKSHRPPQNQKSWSVAILSFYDQQTYLLKKEYRNRYKNIARERVDIKTRIGNVDTMQGREADVVYLSLVRTEHVGYLDNPNRINVAISRAKYQMVMVGDIDFFRNQRKRGDLAIVQLSNKIRESREVSYQDTGYDSISTELPPISRYSAHLEASMSQVKKELIATTRAIEDVYAHKVGNLGYDKLGDLKTKKKDLRNKLRDLRRGGYNGDR